MAHQKITDWSLFGTLAQANLALQVIPYYYQAKGALAQLGGQGGGHPGLVPGAAHVRLLASTAPPLPHQVQHLYNTNTSCNSHPSSTFAGGSRDSVDNPPGTK